MTLKWRTPASAELVDALRYADSQRPGLAAELLDDVEAAERAILERPNSFPEVHRGCRRVLLRRFSYAIVFRVEQDVTRIYAMAHQARQQGYWHDRLN